MTLLYALLLLTVAVSIASLLRSNVYDACAFGVDDVRKHRQYWRLLTSGLVHNGRLDLAFTAISGVLIHDPAERLLGTAGTLAVYVAGLAGANLIALWLHRREGDYQAAGAAGALSGLIFGCVAVEPGVPLGLFGVETRFFAVLYGLGYVLLMLYAVKGRYYFAGHDSHFGGLVAGVLAAIALHPETLQHNAFPLMAMLIPAAGFLWLALVRPDLLFLPAREAPVRYVSVDEAYNTRRRDREQEVDRILEKVGTKGIDSLTTEERTLLDEFSERGR